MRIPPFRPHRRFLQMADAFADDELSDRERSRFEGHLATCEACAARVEAARETKRQLRALPEYNAPRSFRLTPAMVRQARPALVAARPSRVPTLVLRASQATAGLAAAALAVVLIGNISLSSGDDDDNSLPANALQAGEKAGGTSFSGAPAATAAATSAADDTELDRLAGGATTATGTVPPAPRTSGTGQEAPAPGEGLFGGLDTPTSELRDAAGSAGSEAFSYGPEAADASTPSVIAPDADLFALDDRLSQDVAEGDAFPKMEAGLAAILFAAIATAVAAGRKRKGTS